MSKKDSGMGKFLAGLAVGTGLGVLFAPKKGSETREDLKRCIKDLVEKAKNIDPQEVKESINEKIAEIKKELKDLDKEKVLAVAKEKGKAIKEKAEELVELAKEKGTPVLQKAAEDVKAKTADVVREVLVKLES